MPITLVPRISSFALSTLYILTGFIWTHAAAVWADLLIAGCAGQESLYLSIRGNDSFYHFFDLFRPLQAVWILLVVFHGIETGSSSAASSATGRASYPLTAGTAQIP